MLTIGWFAVQFNTIITTFSQAIMQLLFDTKSVQTWALTTKCREEQKGPPTFDQIEVAWHNALVVPGVVVRPARSRRGATGRGQLASLGRKPRSSSMVAVWTARRRQGRGCRPRAPPPADGSGKAASRWRPSSFYSTTYASLSSLWDVGTVHRPPFRFLCFLRAYYCIS
jgi:hypothetical protein